MEKPILTSEKRPVIANEFQYRLTKAQASKFEEALMELQALGGADLQRNQEKTAPPRLHEAEMAALQSQLESLQAEIAEYDLLRSGKTRSFTADSFDELPHALIKARIASGLTQKQLAERLGLKEQQVQQYEATGYASASLKRVSEVIRALGLTVEEKVALR
jgi:ribosome-binding protein aMBF1 (putative translation factor)